MADTAGQHNFMRGSGIPPWQKTWLAWLGGNEATTSMVTATNSAADEAAPSSFHRHEPSRNIAMSLPAMSLPAWLSKSLLTFKMKALALKMKAAPILWSGIAALKAKANDPVCRWSLCGMVVLLICMAIAIKSVNQQRRWRLQKQKKRLDDDTL